MDQDAAATRLATSEPDPGLRQRVFGLIGQILPRVLGREIAGMSDRTQLMSDLGLRSATMLELLLELEDALEMQIEVEDIDRDAMRSVGDLADFVSTHAIADP
jgi:acyl carrier protein